MLPFGQRDMPDPRTAGVGVRVVTDGKENAFRLRKATLFNQGAGAHSTEALHDLTAKRCMELPPKAAHGIHGKAVHVIAAKGGAWNPRQSRGMASTPKALHHITQEQRKNPERKKDYGRKQSENNGGGE